MVAEVICVGTEILMGQILNTNARYLSQKLLELGINLYYHTTVGDNFDRLKNAIDIALKRADILIFTGGLGPTSDDITKEAVCDYFGLELELNQEILQKIEKHFENRGVRMPEINKKQAYVPRNCIILENKQGTAPGLIIEKNGKIAILLPGPPFEMQPMFENEVQRYLSRFSDQRIYSRILKFIGIGESSVEESLSHLINNQSDPTLALYAKPYEVELRISTKKEDEKVAYKLIDDMERKVREILSEYIYGTDNQTLEEVIVSLLAEKGLKVAVAESCTGGLICDKITNISGASAVFDRGFITYSNWSKIKELNVSQKTLNKYGAVSYQTAKEMAAGALNNSNADIAISTTGIAGPTGATQTKPVGLVYVGVATKGYINSFEFKFTGDRLRIKDVASKAALNILRKTIIEKY